MSTMGASDANPVILGVHGSSQQNKPQAHLHRKVVPSPKGGGLCAELM